MSGKKPPKDSIQALLDKAGVTVLKGATPPPRKVNTPPEWSYWNRMAKISRHEAICLTLSLDPRTYFSNDIISRRYKEIYNIAGSHIANFSLRFLNKNARTFRVTDWLQWLIRIDIPVPEGWRPIGLGLKLDALSSIVGGKCWEEAVGALVKLRDAADEDTPRTQAQLFEHILENREEYPNCCPDSVQNVEAIKQRVYREREHESNKNPFKDPRYLNAG